MPLVMEIWHRVLVNLKTLIIAESSVGLLHLRTIAAVYMDGDVCLCGISAKSCCEQSFSRFNYGICIDARDQKLNLGICFNGALSPIDGCSIFNYKCCRI